MRILASSRSSWRGVFMALTVVAISMRLLAPPGFMTAAGPSGPRLVICTGHGPLAIGAERSDPAKAPSGAKSDTPCLFAATAVGPAPTMAMIPRAIRSLARAETNLARSDLIGEPRPISAPPPARGPPGE
jgi:hypothetical protein